MFLLYHVRLIRLMAFASKYCSDFMKHNKRRKARPTAHFPASVRYTNDTSCLRYNNITTLHKMDEQTLNQYRADDPPTVVPLAIKPHFIALEHNEQKYAHYISQ